MLDFNRFEVLSFDCYGTLIDWEKGILGALQPVFRAHNVDSTDAQTLELYAELEPEAQREGQYVEYKQVLRKVMQEFGNRLGFTAEQAKSYKPSQRIFEYAIEKIGHPPERILHIAQSVYHDIIPAKAIGLSAIWVNRRKGQQDFGATRPAGCDCDLEVLDLKSLISYMGLEPR